jgi:hypothetical protein
LWDIVACPLKDKDTYAPDVVKMIAKFVRYSVGYGWNEGPVTRFVFLNYDRENPDHPSDAQYKDLQDTSIIISYPRGGDLFKAMDSELDRIMKRSDRNRLPIICIIPGDYDFSSTLERLREIDTVLIHNDHPNREYIAGASFTAKWSAVLDCARMSLAEQLKILPAPYHFRKEVEEQLKQGTSFLVEEFTRTRLNTIFTAFSLQSYDYSTDLALLLRMSDMGWVVRSSNGETRFCKFFERKRDLRDQLDAIYAQTYIVPETSNQYDRRMCDEVIFEGHVEIECVDHEDAKHVIVRAVDMSLVERVLDEIFTKLEAGARKTFDLSPWKNEHITAFMGSKVSANRLERLCDASYCAWGITALGCLILSLFRCVGSWKRN